MGGAALRWGIKAALVAYVRDLGGTIGVTAPASERDGEFVFPADEEGFAGSVRLTAHGGMLALTIQRPEIVGDRLTIDDDGGRLAIAVLTPVGPDTWTARLSPDGVDWIGGGPYGPGTEFAPVRIGPPAD